MFPELIFFSVSKFCFFFFFLSSFICMFQLQEINSGGNCSFIENLALFDFLIDVENENVFHGMTSEDSQLCTDFLIVFNVLSCTILFFT